MLTGIGVNHGVTFSLVSVKNVKMRLTVAFSRQCTNGVSLSSVADHGRLEPSHLRSATETSHRATTTATTKPGVWGSRGRKSRQLAGDASGSGRRKCQGPAGRQAGDSARRADNPEAETPEEAVDSVHALQQGGSYARPSMHRPHYHP